MYEDKLKEKIRYDRQATEDMFRMLSNMVKMSEGAESSDRSMSALLSVMAVLGVSHPVLKHDDKASDFQSILLKNGILCRSVVLDDKWWKRATGPFLARDKEGVFVALLPSFLGYYRIDRNTGRKVYINENNSRDLEPQVITFCRELPRRKLAMKDLKRYAVRSTKVRNLLYLIGLCMIVVLLGMLVPYANKVIFNEVVPSGEAGGIIPICSLLLGVGLSAALFALNRNMVLTRVKDKLNANLQTAVMARLYSLPNTFFKEFSAGDLSARALSINTVYQLITNELLATVAVSVFSIMYVFIVFVYARSLFWLVTLIIIIFIAQQVQVYHHYLKRNDKVLPNKASSLGFVFSLISGIHKIRNNGAENRAMQQWAKRFSQSELRTDEASWVIKNHKAVSLAILKTSTILIFFYSWKNRLPISDYIAFNAAFGVMMAAMSDFSLISIQISQLLPQLKLMQPILDAVPESVDDSEMVDYISGGLEFSNVSFRYSPTAPAVIDNLSLKIKPGENIGIVGLSGCGKSSLMRLMMGFEKPESGSIFYDQYNLAHTNLNSFHQFTGYCPQELHIFPDTIRNNIKITKPSATDEEVWEAARIACIDEDIRRMPQQMDTVLGEGGSGLSGGQSQRIMIARAILNHPRIIFFDEATSALDNLTQSQVVKNLEQLKCTRVSIAHRLSTIEHCDRIIVLSKGSIVEDGTPDELMQKQGFFWSLAKRQKL